MSSGYRVTEDEWRAIKNKLRWHSPNTAATMMSRSLAVVLKVNASNSYPQYCGMVAAEHPPRKSNSLGDRVDTLEQEVKEILERLRTATALALNEGATHDCD